MPKRAKMICTVCHMHAMKARTFAARSAVSRALSPATTENATMYRLVSKSFLESLIDRFLQIIVTYYLFVEVEINWCRLRLKEPFPSQINP